MIFTKSKTTHEPPRPARPQEPRQPAPLRGEGAAGGGSPRPARPLAPPSITSPALGARLPESSARRLAAPRRPSRVRLSSASLLPCALPAPLGGRRGAFPTTVIFAESKRKRRGFQGARPSERGRRGASPPQAPAPRAGVPSSRSGRRRVGLGAGPGREAAGSSPRGWRPEAASAGALGAEAESERSATGGGRAEGERDPGGSPQCPGATPSPLEDPGTMPKFGGNWGQCPVVFLDAGEALPASWRTRCWAKCVWGTQEKFSNSEELRGLRRRRREAQNQCPWYAGLGKLQRPRRGREQCPKAGNASQSRLICGRENECPEVGTQGRLRRCGELRFTTKFETPERESESEDRGDFSLQLGDKGAASKMWGPQHLGQQVCGGSHFVAK